MTVFVCGLPLTERQRQSRCDKINYHWSKLILTRYRIYQTCAQWRRQTWAWWLSPHKIWLNPPPPTVKQTGQESGCQLIPHFRILIVSAVKTCKQCLQTASASGDIAPGRHWGTSIPKTSWAATRK